MGHFSIRHAFGETSNYASDCLWCRLAALLAPLLGANHLPKKDEKDTFNHICIIFYFCAQQALASLLRSPSDHIKWKSKVFSREGGRKQNKRTLY
jgi:hypothetical protein